MSRAQYPYEANGYCYGLNVCTPPPQIHRLKFYPQWDDIGRWGLWQVVRVRRGHERSALEEASVSLQGSQKSLPVSVLCRVRRQEDGHLWTTVREHSSDSKSASALVLNFPAHRTVRNMFVVEASQSLSGVLLKWPVLTNTAIILDGADADFLFKCCIGLC